MYAREVRDPDYAFFDRRLEKLFIGQKDTRRCYRTIAVFDAQDERGERVRTGRQKPSKQRSDSNTTNQKLKCIPQRKDVRRKRKGEAPTRITKGTKGRDNEARNEVVDIYKSGVYVTGGNRAVMHK